MQPTNFKVKDSSASFSPSKATLKSLIIFALLCLSVQCLNASPEERAQMVKARILDKLSQDGWQLVQESQSLLVIERPITDMMQEFTIRLLTTGANGSKPVFRWAITILPESDHYTKVLCSGSINTQNGFGQQQSYPNRNKKNMDYMNSVIAWASARMPKKYQFIKQ